MKRIIKVWSTLGLEYLGIEVLRVRIRIIVKLKFLVYLIQNGGEVLERISETVPVRVQ